MSPDDLQTRKGVKTSRTTSPEADAWCVVPSPNGRVERVTRRRPPRRVAAIHDAFRAHMVERFAPCLAGVAAIRSEAWWHGIYGEMGEAATTRALHADLAAFVQAQPDFDHRFSTFVASFGGPEFDSEADFEARMWDQLAMLRDVDRARFAPDPRYSTDPADPDFGFSVGGRAFFLVGLHPGASRISRRFEWPSIAFNAEYLFEALAAAPEPGYSRLQQHIRARDRRLQGDINPNLTDTGVTRAREYSGRAVTLDWVCPWHRRSD